jgi:hypothetical protein
MTAVREQIFAAVDAALGAIAGLAEYERMPSGDPARFPAVHTFDDGDSLIEGEAGTDRWAMSLGIDGYVQTDGGAAAHAAINELHADVVSALFGSVALATLSAEIEVQQVRFLVAERASRRRLAMSMDLTIHYATKRGDPRIIE